MTAYGYSNLMRQAITELVLYGTICADTYMSMNDVGIDPEAFAEWFHNEKEA